MFDIGWQELIIIGVIAVIVMGPKELPRALRTVMQVVRKARSMAGEFQRGVDEMVREADLEDLRKDVESAASVNMSAEIERTIDPGGDLRRSLDMKSVERDLDNRESRSLTSGAEGAEDPPPDKAEVVETVPDALAPDKNKAAG